MNQSSYSYIVTAMLLLLDVHIPISFRLTPGATSVRVSDSLSCHEFGVIFFLQFKLYEIISSVELLNYFLILFLQRVHYFSLV